MPFDLQLEIAATARLAGLEEFSGYIAMVAGEPYVYDGKAWVKDSQGIACALEKVLGQLNANNIDGAKQIVLGMLGKLATSNTGSSSTMTGTVDAPKRKRPQNQYNLFVSETMKALAKEKPEMTSKQCMAEAVMLWKARGKQEKEI